MIIGVDIGLAGGIACMGTGIQNSQVYPFIIHLIDIPVILMKIGKKTKNIYNYKAIRDFFVDKRQIVNLRKGRSPSFNIEMVYIEKTQALQIGYRSQASWSLGLGEGFFVGLFEALDIPYEFVRAQEWQKHFGITEAKGDKKVQSYMIAHQLFSTAELTTPRGRKLDGRSDALLIAEWGRRHLKGK